MTEKYLIYKGFEGTAEIDLEQKVCRGKILFIEDLVTYQTANPKGLEKVFQEAVDDYLETCEQLGRQPLKPLKGIFNVRVSPDLHKTLVLHSLNETTSLNDVVVRALTAYVRRHPKKTMIVV
jgi:predicted HicB family RNase H-like nuclease